eukprot:scaffold137393_cov118-Phaeocystis_antarctica.AAC.2
MIASVTSSRRVDPRLLALGHPRRAAEELARLQRAQPVGGVVVVVLGGARGEVALVGAPREVLRHPLEHAAEVGQLLGPALRRLRDGLLGRAAHRLGERDGADELPRARVRQVDAVGAERGRDELELVRDRGHRAAHAADLLDRAAARGLLDDLPPPLLALLLALARHLLALLLLLPPLVLRALLLLAREGERLRDRAAHAREDAALLPLDALDRGAEQQEDLRALGERLGVLERELRDGLLHGRLLLDELGRRAPLRLAQLAAHLELAVAVEVALLLRRVQQLPLLLELRLQRRQLAAVLRRLLGHRLLGHRHALHLLVRRHQVLPRERHRRRLLLALRLHLARALRRLELELLRVARRR